MLGILPVNILYFGAAQARLGTLHPVTTWSADVATYHGIRFFVHWKFITMFALLFGASMALVRRRDDARLAVEGDPGVWQPSTLLKRLLWGWVLGLFHGVSLWWGEVLAFYATLGLALIWWAPGLEPRTQRRIGVAMIATQVLLVVAAAIVWHQVLRPHFPPSARDPGFERQIWGESGPFTILGWRLLLWFMGWLETLFFFGLHFGGLFLIGMSWVKDGLLTEPEKHLPRLRRLARAGLIGGLAAQCLSTTAQVEGPWLLARLIEGEGSDVESYSTTSAILAEGLQSLGGLGLAAAYGATLALLSTRPFFLALLAPFIAVGRTAFSNYVLQSLIANAVFYSYGFALFDRVSLPGLLGVTVAIWVAELVVSPLYLRFFRMGPVEWVWRSLTHGRFEPFRI